MFGTDVRTAVRGMPPDEREDALVAAYMASLADRGRFSIVSSAIVFKPEIESTYFHLIYATRHDKGLEVFKEVERKMQPVMATARASARARKKEARTGQITLLSLVGSSPSSRQATLRRRYLDFAKREVVSLLKRKASVPYEEVWRVALTRPLVWESDLKKWIADWQAHGEVQLTGLTVASGCPNANAVISCGG